MLTKLVKILKELAREYRAEEKGLHACQGNDDLEGEIVQLREIRSIAKAMTESIEALDKLSKEG